MYIGIHDRALYSMWNHFSTFCDSIQYQIEKEIQMNYTEGNSNDYFPDISDNHVDRSPTVVSDHNIFRDYIDHESEISGDRYSNPRI